MSRTKIFKKLSKFTKLSLGAVLTSLYFLLPTKIMAAINNPVIDPALGGDGTEAGAELAKNGEIFTTYFIFLWRAFINIGGIAVLIYFLWGAFEWITAGGDSGKLGNARNRMLHAAIGLIILVSSFTILGFISSLLFGDNFNLLELTFPSPDGSGATTTTTAPTGELPGGYRDAP